MPIFLELVSGGKSLRLAATWTSWFLILYNIDKHAFFLLYSNGVHFSCSSISVTDDLFLYRLVTNLTNLLCTISSLCLSFCRCGILNSWSNEGGVGLFFDTAVGDIEVSFEKSNCFICLGTDVSDMVLPFKV